MNIRPRPTKDGRVNWKLEVMVDGARRYKTVGPYPGNPAQQRKRAEAEWWKLKAKIEAEQAAFIAPSNQKVGDYIETWLRRKERDVRPKTISSYKDTLHRYALPTLANVELKNVSPAMIQNLVDKLHSQGLTRSVSMTRSLLRKAFQDALNLGLVAANPVDRVSQPKTTKKQVEAFTLEEVLTLIQAAPERWRPLLTFAAFSGLRISEVLGLKWEDVDLKRGYVTIRRGLVDIEGRSVLQENTKTEAGARSFTLPTVAADALRSQRKMQLEIRLAAGEGWQDQGFVFASSTGKATGQTTARRAYRAVRDAAGVPKLTFHSLRHTAASIQLASGIPLETVSKRIGHKSRAVTADVYGHMLPQQDQDAATKIDAFLDKHSPKG